MQVNAVQAHTWRRPRATSVFVVIGCPLIASLIPTAMCSARDTARKCVVEMGICPCTVSRAVVIRWVGVRIQPILRLVGASSISSSSPSSATAAPSVVYVTTGGVTVTSIAASPTTSASSSSSGSSGGSSKISAGAIAGIVVGVIGAGAMAGVGFFFYRRNKRRAQEDGGSTSIYGKSPKGTSGHQRIPSTGIPPPQNPFKPHDPRLEPEMMQQRYSTGSLADEQDYSRKILRVFVYCTRGEN